MYIQITTKCSVSCRHCCFSCNTTSGEHMHKHIFKKALYFANEYEYITIGGGEPTPPPNFKEFLLDTIAITDTPLIITNGSVKQHAMLLAHLVKKKIIDAYLSLDSWHDPYIVSEEVIDTFTKMKKIRNSNSVLSHGSALLNNLSDGFSCPCEDIIILPNGNIKQCGCTDSPIIGNVNNINGFYYEPGCYKEL